MLSYRHQGDYFEGDKVSFKYEGRNTRLSYLGFLSKRTQSLVVFHGQKNDVTEEGMHEDATGDKI